MQRIIAAVRETRLDTMPEEVRRDLKGHYTRRAAHYRREVEWQAYMLAAHEFSPLRWLWRRLRLSWWRRKERSVWAGIARLKSCQR